MTPGVARARVTDLGDRRVVLLNVDDDVRLGALSSWASETIAASATLAAAEGLPLIATISSSGADILEGMSALHGWGRAARALAGCSGKVPVIFIVNGPAVSGPALLLGLADIVIMTESSYAFVSGPTMVAEFTGVTIDNEELGGAASHARHTGAASLVVTDTEAALEAAEQILAYLPDNVDHEPPRWATVCNT